MAKLVGSWVFTVVEDSRGVRTRWSVVTDDESEYGESEGPLHNAILDAYEGMGLIAPLVVDNDLLFLRGEVNE